MKKIRTGLLMAAICFLIFGGISQNQLKADEFIKTAKKETLYGPNGDPIGTACIFCNENGLCIVISCQPPTPE